jgi:putative copper export protein
VVLFILWLHATAAVAWIGGMLFLSLVAVPVLNPRASGAGHAELFRALARRFRLIVWGAIAILLLTGPTLLFLRGLSLFDPSPWPSALRLKLALVVILLVLTGTHDLLLGPRVGSIAKLPPADRTGSERVLVAVTPWLARGSLLLALMILGVALLLART